MSRKLPIASVLRGKMKISEFFVKYTLLFLSKCVIWKKKDIKEEDYALSKDDIELTKSCYRICKIVGIPPDCVRMIKGRVVFDLNELDLPDEEEADIMAHIVSVIQVNMNNKL